VEESVSIEHRILANLAAALVAVALVGIAVRGRVHLSRAFVAYLAGVLVCNQLTVWFPGTFWTYGFWRGQEATHASLSILVAFEIALLTFAMFPVARRRVLAAMFGMLLVTLLALNVDASSSAYPWLTTLGLVTPGGQAGRLWLFAIPVLVAAWHRVPLHPFHRAIVLGFGLYLAGYCCLLGFVESSSATRESYLHAHAYLRAIDPIAFAATVGVWAWAAWRAPRPASDVAPAIRALQPWAVSW
jgi:hypothetical protein